MIQVPMYQAKIPIRGGGGGGHIDLTNRPQANPIVAALQQMIQRKRQGEQDELMRQQAQANIDYRTAQTEAIGQPQQTKGRIVVGDGKTWLVNPETGEKRDLGIAAPTSRAGDRSISDIINNLSKIGTLPEGTLDPETEGAMKDSLTQGLLGKFGLEEYEKEVEIPAEKKSLFGIDKLWPDRPARTETQKTIRRKVGSGQPSPITEAVEEQSKERLGGGGNRFAAGVNLPSGSILKGSPLMPGVNMPSGTIIPKDAKALRTIIPDENGRPAFIPGDNVPVGTLLPPDPNPMLRSWYNSDAQRQQAESLIKEPRTPYQQEEYNYNTQLGQAIDQIMASETKSEPRTGKGGITGQRPHPGGRIPGDLGYTPTKHPGGKIPSDASFKGKPGTRLPFDRSAKRPPKPKKYPNAKWSEEHQMWTVVKNGRLIGIQ